MIPLFFLVFFYQKPSKRIKESTFEISRVGSSPRGAWGPDQILVAWLSSQVSSRCSGRPAGQPSRQPVWAWWSSSGRLAVRPVGEPGSRRANRLPLPGPASWLSGQLGSQAAGEPTACRCQGRPAGQPSSQPAASQPALEISKVDSLIIFEGFG